jgi:hypothetical protein
VKDTLEIGVIDSSEIKACGCFRGTYSPHPQSKQVSKHTEGAFIATELPYFSILKMEAEH